MGPSRRRHGRPPARPYPVTGNWWAEPGEPTHISPCDTRRCPSRCCSWCAGSARSLCRPVRRSPTVTAPSAARCWALSRTCCCSRSWRHSRRRHWGRAAGWGWLVIDMTSDILALNGVHKMVYLPLRYGGHVSAAPSWPAAGGLRPIGLLAALDFGGYSFAAPFVSCVLRRACCGRLGSSRSGAAWLPLSGPRLLAAPAREARNPAPVSGRA